MPPDYVRVVELDDQPWFVAADVFDTLQYPKGSRTYQLVQLGDDEVRVSKIQTPRSKQDMKLISESGLYKLIMRSDKPEAKAFQDWVTKVVLPAIRKDVVISLTRRTDDGSRACSISRCRSH